MTAPESAMPMFEFHCTRCDDTIEVLLRHGDPEPALCGDDCALEGAAAGAGPLSRKLSLPGGYSFGAATRASAAREGRAEQVCGACGEAPQDA